MTLLFLVTICFPVVVMVFDFHDFDTLGNIEKWKRLVDEKINEAFFFLVGSKKDIVVIAFIL